MWFNNSNKEVVLQRKMADLEISQIGIDLDIRRRQVRVQLDEEKAKLILQAAEQNRTFEHTFHSTMEAKKAELLKLDSDIAYHKQHINDLTATVASMLAEKDATIATLKQVIENLTRPNTVKV